MKNKMKDMGLFTAVCLMCFLLSTSVLCEVSADNWPPIPAKMVAQYYLFNRYWDCKMGADNTTPDLLTIKINDKQLLVWVKEFDDLIFFDYKNGQLYPIGAVPLKSHTDEDLFAGIEETPIDLSKYKINMQPFNSLESNKQKMMLESLFQRAFDTDFLRLINNNLKRPVHEFRFRIGPVDIEYPVMYFCTEGMPYVNTCYFNTQSFKSVYTAGNYIGDEVVEGVTVTLYDKLHQYRVNLLNAIEQEGEVYKLGLLPAEVEESEDVSVKGE